MPKGFHEPVMRMSKKPLTWGRPAPYPDVRPVRKAASEPSFPFLALFPESPASWRPADHIFYYLEEMDIAIPDRRPSLVFLARAMFLAMKIHRNKTFCARRFLEEQH